MKLPSGNAAPGGPGITARWTLSAKSGVGTAPSVASRVWYTLSHGILDEIYYPRVDYACTRDFGLIVTDGIAYFSEEKRDTESLIRTVADGVPAFMLRNEAHDGRYRIEKTVLADPDRDVVLQRVRFEALAGELGNYRLYALLAPHLVNRGANNTAWVGVYKGREMLFASGSGNALALACSVPWRARSVRAPHRRSRLRHTGHRENFRLTVHCARGKDFRREPVAGVSEMHQVFHRGTQGGQQGSSHARRKQAGKFSQALGDHLTLAIRIAAAIEHHLDGREALARRRANRFYVFGSGQQSLQWARDQGLHLGRVEARRLGLHQYMRRSEIGEHVEPRREQRAQPERGDQTGERGDNAWIAQGGANDGGEHCVAP